MVARARVEEIVELDRDLEQSDETHVVVARLVAGRPADDRGGRAAEQRSDRTADHGAEQRPDAAHRHAARGHARERTRIGADDRDDLRLLDLLVHERADLPRRQAGARDGGIAHGVKQRERDRWLELAFVISVLVDELARVLALLLEEPVRHVVGQGRSVHRVEEELRCRGRGGHRSDRRARCRHR